MPPIDYTALSPSRTVGAKGDSSSLVIKLLLGGVGVLVLLMVLTPIALLFSDNPLLLVISGLGTFFMSISVLGLIVAAVVYGLGLRKKQLARLEQFATSNGAVFIHDTAVTGYSGLIFDNGRSRQMRESIRFKDGVEVGNYQFVTGSGKNSRTHLFAFVRVPLVREMPHIVLDARKGNFLGSNLPDTFDRSQRLQLEGDFNKYFDVYVPKQYEADALYVLTPDVMQALVNYAGDLDVEIVGKELYIYRTMPLDISNEAQLKPFLGLVDTLSKEITAQTRRYADERGALMADGTRMVADEGRRLKTGVNWIVVLIAGWIITMQVSIFLLPPEWVFATQFISGAVFWIVIFTLIIRSVRSRR